MVREMVVSVIAAGPDETVPDGILLELVHLPSFNTDEVRSWVAQNRTGPVFVLPGVEMASKGTPSLPVEVSQEEYLMLTAAMPR
jgi:hypothetical protein